MAARIIKDTHPKAYPGDILSLSAPSGHGPDLEFDSIPDCDGEIRVDNGTGHNTFLGPEERAALVAWLLAIDEEKPS